MDKLELNRIYFGDCLQLMKLIPDESIDMILADLPYGTTSCSWDSIIDMEKLWVEYRRLVKKTGAIVLTASQPFSTMLIHPNIDIFKYSLVWKKSRPTGHVHAKNKPLKEHEDILVFSKGTTVHKSQSINRMTYNPIGATIVNKVSYRPSREEKGSDVVAAHRPSHRNSFIREKEGYPRSVIEVPSEHNVGAYHHTQKPVLLFEKLILMYSNEGEIVLDNTAGGGTTAIACLNTGRNYILMENDPETYQKAYNRIVAHKNELATN